MYYFYGKINREHVVCPLYAYGCGPYLGESVIGDSTVVHGIDSHIKYQN